MRDDDQVKVALSLKKDMLLNSGWSIVVDSELRKEQKDDKQADDIEKFVSDNLRNIGVKDGLENGWDEVLRDILSAYDYGFSLSEPIFRSPATSLTGKWELSKIKVRPPHSFIFHLDEKGNVLEIEQLGGHTLKFKPETFMHHVYQPEFGNPYGKSDLKAAHPAWKAKKFIFRMAMRYAERFAGALAVGRYSAGMSADEVAKFHNILKTIQDNTSLTIPEEAKVELVQVAKDSSDSYNKLLHMLNMWIARAILIPDLMGMSGEQTSGGSLALGKEQFKVFINSIKNDRITLQRKITIKIIEPLVQANFGNEVRCRFEFKPMEAGEESELLRLWVDAVNGKMFKPSAEEVNTLRRKTGFPEGEVEFHAEPAQIGPDGLPMEDKAKPGDKDKDAKKDEKPKEGKKFSLREASAHEAKMDFASIAKTFDASESKMDRELVEIARRMARDLMEQGASIVENFKPERLNNLKPRFQKEMNDAIKGHFISLFRNGVEFARREIHGNNAKNFVADDIYPDEFEDIIVAESFKMVGDISQDILKRSKTTILDAIKSGASQREVIKKLMAELENHTENNIRTIVRTRTTEVFNAGRKTFFDTDEVAKEIITGYQFSAVLDERTTAVCSRLDGKVFDKNEADYIARTTPPLHFNCRSLLVPVTRFEEVKFNKPVEIERLKELGGGLIFTFLQDLNAALLADKFGDTVAISAPGEGKRIRVKAYTAALRDMDKSVVCGVRFGAESDVINRVTLSRTQGVYSYAPPEAMMLPENTDFILNLSAPVPTDFTVSYEIMNAEGSTRLA
jgi:SPP1 gp7 family putative phage head morphogenesis protein